MPLRILAALIVCVAMLAHALAFNAASFAASRSDARSGFEACKLHAAQTAIDGALRNAASGETPADDTKRHDHGSCPLCQLGVSAPPLVDMLAVALIRTHDVLRVAIVARDQRTSAARFNRGAPVRAPPSHA